MERTDNTLKILVTVSSILFLLIAIKTSYPAENIGEMTINIAGKFVIYELILFSAIYVAGPMLSEAMPKLWKIGSKTAVVINDLRFSLLKIWLISKVKSFNLQKNKESENDKIHKSTKLTTTSKVTKLSDEIINYVTKTFENILSPEQIEKILSGLRNFNNGEKFEVIVKEELPDYIYQFDILHFVWNITKRIHNKRHSKYKFRDRAAEFAKSSFPLIVTSTLDSIGSTMSNDENRTFSLPIIKLGIPLIPHDFSEAKEHLETNS